MSINRRASTRNEVYLMPLGTNLTMSAGLGLEFQRTGRKNTC